MKKTIGIILGMTVMAMVMFFNTNSVNSTSLNLENLASLSTANAEIPINFGSKGCVCKGSTCQDQNWVSFRKYCGYQNGGQTCADAHNGQCN